MADDATPDPQVLVSRTGGVGRLHLNRPKAMNALTVGMIETLQDALDDWRDDDSIDAVLLTGEGERGLCAGGDIVTLYRSVTAGDPAEAAGFFWNEYRLNASIGSYPKPYIALMDGVVFGGGVGVSAHGSHRVVTERSKLAMPETGIGFAPDVGGLRLLSRAPGEIGTLLALTGIPIGAGDAIALGLADSFLSSDRIPEFIAVVEADGVDAVAALAEPAPASTLLAERHWIDEVFSAVTIHEMVDRLASQPGELAASVLAKLRANAPTALAVTLEARRRVASMPLEDALRQDYRLATNAIRSRDLAEGIRAQVIDKDRTPRWAPSTIDEVALTSVEAYFDLAVERDLTFD